jgi:hypothetical protein
VAFDRISFSEFCRTELRPLNDTTSQDFRSTVLYLILATPAIYHGCYGTETGGRVGPGADGTGVMLYVLPASWPNGPVQVPLERSSDELHLFPCDTCPVHCDQLTELPWFQA